MKLLNQRKLEGLKEKWWNKNPLKAECDDSEQQSDGISIANIGKDTEQHLHEKTYYLKSQVLYAIHKNYSLKTLG